MVKLYGRAGWGSVLIEAQLVWYGVPFSFEEVDDVFTSAEARARLAAVNPLAQLPTLVLAEGSIMTESAAITLVLAELENRRGLVPPPGDPARPRFLRWLIFIVTNIYPTFTYADEPARFVREPSAQGSFRTSVDDYAKKLWRMMEDEAATPWFLRDFSALDIYIAAMTRWRPGRDWFAARCPRLYAISVKADALPQLTQVWERNFPAGQNPD